MKDLKISLLMSGLLVFTLSCKKQNDSKIIDEYTWKLGWRMIENAWDKKNELADMQFDSLLNLDKPINDRFLIEGLKIKLQVSKEKEALNILYNQPNNLKVKVCGQVSIKDLQPCKDLSKEKILNKALQLKILTLFVQDQAIRGNILQDIISKYQIDTVGIKTVQDWSNPDEVGVDDLVRTQLKEIFEEYGPLTSKLIGKDAMRGVFYIIQHADGDLEWQESQLAYIASGVNSGEFTKINYAYLYDRIHVNSGKPQRYGSQFAKVDFKNGVVELRVTEDFESIDQRRREMEMMPIEMYKRSVLR